MQKVGKDYNKDAKRQRRTLRFIFPAEETVEGRLHGPAVYSSPLIFPDLNMPTSKQEERIKSLINQWRHWKTACCMCVSERGA